MFPFVVETLVSESFGELEIAWKPYSPYGLVFPLQFSFSQTSATHVPITWLLCIHFHWFSSIRGQIHRLHHERGLIYVNQSRITLQYHEPMTSPRKISVNLLKCIFFMHLLYKTNRFHFSGRHNVVRTSVTHALAPAARRPLFWSWSLFRFLFVFLIVAVTRFSGSVLERLKKQ